MKKRPKRSHSSLLSSILWRLMSLFLTTILLLSFVFLYLQTQLPDVEALKDIQLQVPLKIFTRDGKLIGEFGEMRSSPIPLEKIPPQLINAVLATEDQRFYEHPGVDIYGLLRAALNLALTGHVSQGGGTITMQVARSFYLSPEKKLLRKLKEILLAIKIDKELSKQKILEIYLNKIYFGNRAYGVAAAAQVYYGKPLNQLTLAELAMVAGLPQRPSAINPIVNLTAAKQRRDHVLARMLALGHINQKTYDIAIASSAAATYHGQRVEVHAPYVAEMVREAMINQYDDVVYTHGYRVYTTIDSNLQTVANQALRSGLLAYDQRHGFRKIKRNLNASGHHSTAKWRDALSEIHTVNGLKAAAIMSMTGNSLKVLLAKGQTVTVPWNSFVWTQAQTGKYSWIPRPTKPAAIFKTGDVIRVQETSADNWQIGQIPQVEGALVALNPLDGAIHALVGGFDYGKSNYNKVTQTHRQPGSSFKPFIYAAALDHGYTLASVINDAPIVLPTIGPNSVWRPQNDTRKFYGPTRLRNALAHSINLVTIRLLQDIGTRYALSYIERFGFDLKNQPKELSLALGTGSVTPLEMAAGYAIFANGGYKVAPYLIERVENVRGELLYQSKPKTVCTTCATTADTEQVTPEANEQYAPQVISSATAFLINSALQDVIRHGTAHAAASLNRQDIAGKTGSTNDTIDAWFSGYNGDLVATAWVGFERPYPLKEHGSKAALPIWMEFMQTALTGRPEHTLTLPADITSIQIDPQSGLLPQPGQSDAIAEYFRRDTVPTQEAPVESEAGYDTAGAPSGIDPLF